MRQKKLPSLEIVLRRFDRSMEAQTSKSIGDALREWVFAASGKGYEISLKRHSERVLPTGIGPEILTNG